MKRPIRRSLVLAAAALALGACLAFADPSIQVVIFTNFDEEEIIEGAADAGAVFVLKGNLRALRAALTLG